jgi:hypothetical protein
MFLSEELRTTLQAREVSQRIIDGVLPVLLHLGARPDNLVGLTVSHLTAEGVSSLDAGTVVAACQQTPG